MALSWIIFTFLVGWCWPIFWPWWWWWWRWRWWWPWPRPPIPDPPPYEEPRFDWVSHIAGGIGGAVAWVGLGRDLAPDGGLLDAALIAFAGAATLGSLASGLMGGAGKRTPPTTSA
ncbi:MAG TPA: hypothetical protein VF759_13180 [Allosphingosinicella sp.]